MTMELTILGCGSAKPLLPDRNMAAQVLNHDEILFLIDCGEGTQLQMQKFGIKMARIERVFISHLHGDHFLGLPGLISTFGMNGRKEPLTIHAHIDLASWLTEYFRISRFFPDFPILFEPISEETNHPIFQNPALEVWSIPLKHPLPTSGFLFREKPKLRKILPHLLPASLPYTYFDDLKNGLDIEYQGIVYSNATVTADPPVPRSFAYCSDTAYDESVIPYIKGVDLLYHEATFLEQHQEKAQEKQHATTCEAAQIAQLACVEKLVIGHFSSRYKDLSGFLEEARSIFPDTDLAFEGMNIPIL